MDGNGMRNDRIYGPLKGVIKGVEAFGFQPSFKEIWSSVMNSSWG